MLLLQSARVHRCQPLPGRAESPGLGGFQKQGRQGRAAAADQEAREGAAGETPGRTQGENEAAGATRHEVLFWTGPMTHATLTADTAAKSLATTPHACCLEHGLSQGSWNITLVSKAAPALSQ